jgi:hypothetical protein
MKRRLQYDIMTGAEYAKWVEESATEADEGSRFLNTGN